MKTTLAISCIVYAIVTAGAEVQPTDKKTSLSESDLRTLATAVPDVKNAGILYSAAMSATSDIERKQEYLKASAACLFACGKKDVYMKRIKDKLSSASEFERKMKDNCKQCSGSGKKDRQCAACNGKGRCISCKGSGRTVTMAFDRPNGSKQCRKCNGSGSCPNCGGKGSTVGKCAACSGTGKTFSMTVAERVFHDSCNAIADSMRPPPKKVATSPVAPKNVATNLAPKKEERQNEPKSNVAVVTPPQGAAESFDEMRDIVFLGRGCERMLHYNALWVGFAENAFGECNYFFSKKVNAKPVAAFQDGSSFDTHDLVIFSFPTHEMRESWSIAMRCACEKMLEWINTARENRVGHVAKELPESAFNNKMAYASVDYIENTLARTDPYSSKVYMKHFDRAELLKTMRKVEFKCVIDSSDNTKFSATLAFGCNGLFPFTLFACSRKTLDEIRVSAQNMLQKTEPDSIAKIWHSQIERNSKFRDGIDDDNLCQRVVVPGIDMAKIEKNATYHRVLGEDYCLAQWEEFADRRVGGCNSLVIKDSMGNWNYTLMIGINGVPQRKKITSDRRSVYQDYDFDYHLLVFPTGESRKRWYEILKKSCGRMLEWVEQASKEHVVAVSKKIYDVDDDDANKLTACSSTLTKGIGQSDILKKALRTHISHSEYLSEGCPVSLRCSMISTSAECKKYTACIILECGEDCQVCVFNVTGTYEHIRDCIFKYLYRMDPDVLMKAWKDKYGRQDLFK